MIAVLIVISIYAALATFAMINVMMKNEKLENVVSNQIIYIDNLNQAIEFADNKLKQIDSKGTFKSDDEIGWFFKNIIYIQDLLNGFKLNIYEENEKAQENIKKIKENSEKKSKEFQGTVYDLSQETSTGSASRNTRNTRNTGGIGGTNGTTNTQGITFNPEEFRQPRIY